MASSATTVKDAIAIFNQTCATFFDALTPEEQKIFQKHGDANSMLQRVAKQCQDHPVNKSVLLRCAARLDKIRKKLEPFFAIISTFAQSNADIACLIWGSFRLLFHFGQNYATFLERIYTMLDDMIEVLPAYEEYVDQVQSRYAQGSADFAPRLLKALSFVYSDILDFCLGALKILSPKRGARAKVKVIWGIGWRPFDERFRAILERFDKHTHALEREMGATTFRLMGAHCERVEFELEKARREHTAKDERQMMEDSATKLKSWIGADDWESLYESFCDRRVPGTCEWIQNESVYKSWIRSRTPKSRFSLSSVIEEDILLIDAKPGYGKTILCASLIERDRYKKEQFAGAAGPSVAFFFFNRLEQNRKTLHSDAAFRALLAQLLHDHEFEADVIDALTLLKHGSGRGQLQASMDEVLCLLHWLLHRYPSTVLLFDGVDECVDDRVFFRSLEKILSHQSDAKSTMLGSAHRSRPGIVLFARPTLVIPLWVRKRLCSIHLGSSENQDDIKTFLTDKLTELADYGLLDESEDITALVWTTCNYANGMFLWARLLIEYLNADGLSINDRAEALNNLVRFEGLDQMYSLILRSLAKKLPPKSKANLHATFQWVGGGLQPLHIDELPHAIASTTEGLWTEKDLIPNLKDSVIRMSGALLELGRGNTVRFAHTSIVDYLSGNHLMHPDRAEEKEFYMSPPSVQQLLSISCLRYLTQTIPPEPLSGDSQIPPIKATQKRRFPLAEYSLGHWVPHTNFVLSVSPKGPALQHFFNKLLQILQGFLQSRKQIMAWIELSWLYEDPATLGDLPKLVEQLFTGGHVRAEEYPNLLQHLKLLNNDLHTLENRWGSVLLNSPNEIWEPSIPAFNESNYYLATKDAKVMAIDTTTVESEKWVTIQSQVSLCGTEIGIIKLSVPRTVLKNEIPMDLKQWMQCHTSGWKTIFEVWSLSDKALVFRFFVPVPSKHAKYILNQQAQFCNDVLYKQGRPLTLEKLDFGFPVALSHDLRAAIMLGSHVKVVHDGGRHNVQISVLDPWTDLATPRQANAPPPLIPTSFSAYISHSGQEMLVARPSNLNGNAGALTMDLRYWDLLLYHSLNKFDRADKKRFVVSLRVDRFDLAVDHQKLQEFGKHFLFHPVLPVLIFSLGRQTVAWSYLESGGRIVQIYRKSLANLGILQGGKFLQGLYRTAKGDNLVALDIDSILCEALNLVPMRYIDEGVVTGNAISSRDLIRQGHGELARNSTQGPCSMITLKDLALSENTAGTMNTGAVTFATNEKGMVEMPMLRQFEAEGAVVLHTLSEDGIARAETITRLPEDLVSRSEPVLVKAKREDDEEGEKGEEMVRLVLNQRSRATYSFRDEEEEEEVLPIVLERTTKSIPVTVIEMGRRIC
ncbi:hypothetical protein P154DRAFT_517874 [Amniculicola lignicola CBS 123094]|uniref:NACHT domain-containing protein n=1 Tax=Amniculicola lignicola CBS 123094 TaxID=1392246 RepID=A0A6A5X0T0_9PLEO|nr:hypothetical protein P154DRAFT_517874 [Amniculicola lignicola CBS 123094]